ncbi:MAG TPA: pirin family protein [Thermoleophilia bacterium]|nr:pirin family protein [Thermoleophilia bacterium]
MDAQVRSIAKVVEPQQVLEGAGVRLRRSIGGWDLDYLDPFLLLDHFDSDDPADYRAGFPLHPHRGIETVTYMLSGHVDHKDTLGNAGTIGPGDLQWMTSGGGIMHEEMPRVEPGRNNGFQLWVNMPAELKMSEPRYRDVSAATVPVVERPDGTTVRVIAGTVEGVQGPVAALYADPEYLDVSLAPGATADLPVAAGHNAFAYAFEGGGWFGPGAGDDAPLPAPRLVVLGDGELVRAEAGDAGLRFLLVSGAPLGEPVARYGPFVMNTRAELQQALDDLRAGTFVWTPGREAGGSV